MSAELDGSADQQIASYVETLSSLEARTQHVLSLLPRCVGIDGRTTSRAFSIAGRLLGARYEVSKYVCLALRMQETARAYKHCGDPDLTLIGYVYECEPYSPDGTYKIGFSRTPKMRVKRLSAQRHQPLRLLSAHLGTMLDEHAQHCALRADRLPGEGEWFRRPSNLREAA
jgi:hypothetical protein